MDVMLKLVCPDEEKLNKLWDEFYKAKTNLEDALIKMKLEPEAKESPDSGN